MTPIVAAPLALVGAQIAELAIAGIITLGGIRSLVVWLGRDYRAGSLSERLLFSLHVMARVGLWFAFAGFFVGYALFAEPQDFRWYFFVPIGLASVQLLTGLALSRLPEPKE